MTWVLHPGGEAQYYLGLREMIQVYDINTAQLWEPGSCIPPLPILICYAAL